MMANEREGPDTIRIPDDLLFPVFLSDSITGDDTSVFGDLDIHDDLVIEVSGGGTAEIDALFQDRAFDVIAGTVTIRDLTIKQGSTAQIPENGSAIRNATTLTLENVTVSDSIASTSPSEGAISNTGDLTLVDVTVEDNTGDGIHASAGEVAASSLTVTGNSISGLHVMGEAALATIEGSCVFSGNTTGVLHEQGRARLTDCVITGNGPSHGVYNLGFLTLTRCTVSGNTNQDSPRAGAGIRNEGLLELIDSRITGNDVGTSGSVGAGLLNLGIAIVRGSTFDGNAAAFGAAIHNLGTALVENSTLSGNFSGSGIDAGGVIDSSGTLRLFSSTVVGNPKGVELFGFAGATELRSTLLDNVGDDCPPPIDGFGEITSLGGNLSGDTSCNSVFSAVPDDGDQEVVPALPTVYEPSLASNGGPTPTHALETGSPALEAASEMGCPRVDQRGLSRPQDSALCDIGAVQEVSGVAANPQCSDGIDNDGDLANDLADTGCTGPDDPLELTLELGDILVTSPADSAVYRVDPMTGDNQLLARGAGLAAPYGIAVPDIEIAVADFSLGVAYLIDRDTGEPQLVGGGVGGVINPRGIAIAPYDVNSNGEIYMTGRGSDTLVEIDRWTGFSTEVTGDVFLNEPIDIDVDIDGTLLVSELDAVDGSDGIVRVDPDLGFITNLYLGSEFVSPRGIAPDGSGQLIVADSGAAEIISLDLTTETETLLTSGLGLVNPRGLGIEASGDFIVGERFTGELFRVTAAGAVMTPAINAGDLLPPNLYHLAIVVATIDIDGDLVSDVKDNCPTTENPLQTDTDWDGIGDACNDADDADGDEWADLLDNCPAIANMDQTDTDSDGTGDVCDDDDDNDGLLDVDEVTEGTDPLDPDTDGDGFLDGSEVGAGTDPLDPLDFFPPEQIPAFGSWGTAVLASLFLLAAFLVFRFGPRRT
jgi:streptogramin lyase